MLQKIRVVRWSRICSRIRGWTWGQMLDRASPSRGVPGVSSMRAPSAPMSSMGTMTSRSSSLRTPASTTVTGRGPSAVRPPRNRAISSSGRCVAERPMRCGGLLARSRRAVRATARGARRAWCRRSAWISSTITHWTSRSVSRAPGREHEVERLGRGDEDVGRVAAEGGALLRRRVTGADADGRRVQRLAPALGRGPDPRDRRAEVLLHVDREGLDRREVEDPRALGLLGNRIRSRAGRSPTGTRPGSCPTRWGRGSGCGRRPRWRASPWPGRRWARRTWCRTTPAPLGRRDRAHPPRPHGTPAL